MSKIASTVVKMIISHYLDSYINPVQKLQLNVGITEGNAELNNVTLKPTALSTHHLPFTVTNGNVQSIKFQIPWFYLKKKPCIIEIDGIHIIAKFTKTIKLKSELEIKESVLKDLEEAGLGDEQIQSALFQGLSSVVIANLIVNIKNIHISIVIDTPDPNTKYAIGIMCNQIECFTINDKGEQSFVKPEANISKRIKIHDFSIYADSHPELLDLPTTEGKVDDFLQMRYKENHEYILDSFSFSSDYVITKDQLKTYSKMENLIDQISFKLTQSQMPVFGEYLFQFNLFQLRQKYSLCGRPRHPPNESDKDDEVEEKKASLKWWNFLHQCTIEKRYPNRIKIPETLLILKNRNEYYDVWKFRQSMSIQDFKKNSRYQELKSIENKLPLNSILFLRNYSDYRINKEKKEKLVVDQSDLEMLSQTKTYESNIDISLLIKRIMFNIYQSPKDSNPILTFDANELNSKFNQSFDNSVAFSLICKAMKIYSKEKVIFQQDSENRDSVEFNYKNNSDTKEKYVDIIASTPFINVDLKFLYRLKVMLYDNGFNKCPSSSYFSFSKKIAEIMTEESNKYTPYMIRKGQYADMILQKKCDEYPFMKIKMQLLSPRVQIQGAKLSFKMKEIDLESFPIHGRSADQIETLYSNYLIKCTDFTIGLGENEILKPVTINFNLGWVIFPVEWLDKFKIALNVSSIAVVFTKDTYREIVSGITQLLKLSQEYEQKEVQKALKTQKEEKTVEKIMENVNVENLSTNFATKVSIVFNNISLELVTVGKFDIVNFETQITIGSNGLGLDLRVQNIICNSLKDKYIFFDINETESDNHFLKENNAIVCQYTLFFDKAIKMNMSINSPTIIIDFGWIESTLDFFKHADIKALMHFYQQPPEIINEVDTAIIETVMTSSIEFQLLKPTFKVILPALNKFKDDVELTLNIDYISYGGIESETEGKQNKLLKMPTFSFEWKKRLEANITNFSVLLGDSISLFFDHLTIFDVIENKKNIEIIPLCKQDESNSFSKPFLTMKIDNNEIDTTVFDFSILFDVNSYMIPELILSLLKSSVIAKIVSSFIDETEISAPKIEEKPDEKQDSSKYKVHLPNANVILIDNDVKLNSHFNGLFNLDSYVNHVFFKELSLSFSEKESNFAPIFENITFEFGINKGTLLFSLNDTNAYVSPSDIIDVMNFVNKVMNLYSNFSHQLDYSRAEAEPTDNESNPIENVCLSNGKVVLEFCEDNRTTEIPFPFLRLILKSNSTNVSLKKAPSFFLLGFQIDIFNKNTQRWDLLVEPLEIYLSYTNTKNYNLEIKEKMNVVLSHAILNQICQFQFERQSIDHKNVLPSFLIENNTHDICEFIYNDKKDNMVIPPKCTTALRKLEPFKFMETVIDPLNFYSPQFISNKYSLSIFIKGKKRHVSINAPLLLKNKSDVNLFYQERHTGKVIELNKKSITPLFKLTAEFAIYGKNPAKTPNAINLFKLKEKKQLDIAVFVEDKIYHFYLSIKFTKKRGIVMLKIAPKFIIRNNHIFPIDFTVNDTQEIRIPPKSTEYMNQIDFDSSFNFFIEVGRYVSPTTKLNLKNNTHMAVYLGIDSAFSLRYDKEIDKGVFKEIITLQPPLLVKNQTDLPVTIFDHHNEPILTLKTKNSEDFFGPRDFLKDNKIRLSFQIEGYEKSDIFDTTIGRKEMFLKSLENNLYIPIALLISIGATGIIHLKIDHLIYIRNESTDAFYFQPDEAIKTKIKSLDINPSQTKPVLFCTPELDFIFSIDKIEQEIISINLQNTLENRNKFATLFINQYDMKIENQHILSVDFKTSSTLAGYLIEIKNCVFPQPLVLTNLLGEKNESQKGEIVVYYGSHSQKIVKPMSTSIISSRDLVGQKLKISCYNRKIKVNLTKFTEPTENILEMEDIKLTVFTKLVCLENGSHMIIVSNEIENKPNRFNLFSTHEISFGLTIPFISLNLIDDQMRELSLIGLQNTSIKCQFTKDTVECDLQIDLFQIDDMYPDTIVPVAVFNSSPPFISLKVIKENANMIFDLIELKMKPLTFYIDINYIAELFNFFTTIKKKERDETVEVKATSNRSSIPILIKKLFIDKIDIHASASSQTDRPKFHPFPYDFIIDVIPSVASIHIDRNQFTKSNLTSDNKVLNKMLKDYYNPLVNELKGLVAAHSISFAFVGLSNAIHKMNSQTKIDVAFNQEKGKVVQRGFQQFGKGLLNGVTGIIMKPVKGLKKDGAKGFFIGLGKGVGGIITDPLAGVIDASNGIVGEIKNALSESRDSMRFPRVFNNIQIQEYDDISAVCQLQYQRHIKNYNDCFVFFVKGEDKYIGITESFVALLVLNTQSKKPSKKYKVHNLRSIGDIESVNSFNKFLIIQFKDEFVIDIECQSNEIADIATKIIVSRSYYNNYSSNAASMTKMASTDFVIDDGEKRETKQVCVIADGFYSLKNSTGKYVTNDKEYMPLVANRGSAKGWEKFKITNNDDGTISFLSCKNNKFVSVGSKSKLFANATKIGQNEKFSVTKVDDKHFSFISMKTRQYVSADRNHFAHLYANRDVAKGWEKFELVPR